jgi:flagellar protein FliS
MSAPIRHTYLTNDVMAASPQKLQLMLIEAALREGIRARDHWHEQHDAEAIESIVRAQKIVAEMIQGLRPEQAPELVGQVAGVYLFIYRALVAAQADHSEPKLSDAIRVLEVERETWQQVCAQLVMHKPHFQMAERFTLEA